MLEREQEWAPGSLEIWWDVRETGEIVFTARFDPGSAMAFDPDAPVWLEPTISCLRWQVHFSRLHHADAVAFLEQHGAPPFLTLYREVWERIQRRRLFVELQEAMTAAAFHLPRERLPGGRPLGERPRQPAHRAEQLLREWLSPAQLAQYDRERAFEVIGSATGARYRIDAAPSSFNVSRLDERGHPLEELCFAPEGAPAKGDILLAQKIALETDERNALEIANRQMLDGSVLPGAGLFGPLLDRIFSLVP